MFFFLIFFFLFMSCLLAGRDYQIELFLSQTEQQENDCKKNAVRCPLGFTLWIFVTPTSLLPLLLVLMVSYMFIAWPHVARGSQEL